MKSCCENSSKRKKQTKKAFVNRAKAHERYKKQVPKSFITKKKTKKAFGKRIKALEYYEKQLRKKQKTNSKSFEKLLKSMKKPAICSNADST